ncbi:unnamed protein product, partial [Laminaria digitata]
VTDCAREDSPPSCASSSFNLDLSLTPQVSRTQDHRPSSEHAHASEPPSTRGRAESSSASISSIFLGLSPCQTHRSSTDPADEAAKASDVNFTPSPPLPPPPPPPPPGDAPRSGRVERSAGVGARSVGGSSGSADRSSGSSSCGSCSKNETAESGSPWSLNPLCAADMWPSARGAGSPGAPGTPCHPPVAAATAAITAADTSAAATASLQSPGAPETPCHPPVAPAAAASATTVAAAAAASSTAKLRPSCLTHGSEDRADSPQRACDSVGDDSTDGRNQTVGPQRAPGGHLKTKVTSYLGGGAVGRSSGS